MCTKDAVQSIINKKREEETYQTIAGSAEEIKLAGEAERTSAKQSPAAARGREFIGVYVHDFSSIIAAHYAAAARAKCTREEQTTR